MISNAQIKLVKALQIKKYRNTHQMFPVEGAKNIQEILKSDYKIAEAYLTESFAGKASPQLDNKGIKYEIVTEKDLERMGSFQSNNAGLLLVEMKANELLLNENELVLVLDDLRDPGNLGTLIRICDWYGIRKILCSENTAEMYNPKVIAASMGSFSRVKIYYCDLMEYFKKYKKDLPVYGAFLEGDSLYETHFDTAAFIVLGNESHGISSELVKLVSKKITIPSYGKAESLNAAIAGAIIIDNVKRLLSGK
ncbi:MAG: RNA methyltransferase [Cytophagaceae bacterium]